MAFMAIIMGLGYNSTYVQGLGPTLNPKRPPEALIAALPHGGPQGERSPLANRPPRHSDFSGSLLRGFRVYRVQGLGFIGFRVF